MEINKLIIFTILTIVFCGIPNVSGKPDFENFFENRQSKYVMGRREEGDKLIINDELRNSLSDDGRSVDKNIKFNYPIHNKIITYVELGSDSNVSFNVSLGDREYLTGTVTALEPVYYFVKVTVYGVERTDATKHLESYTSKPILTFQSKPREIEDVYMDEIENNDESVIILGNRQEGDHLLYKDRRGSGVSNFRSKHNVTFYYNDENFVTCAIFRCTATNSYQATIEYSRVSPHTLKAVIKDHNTFEMNAYMEVYGYEPDEKPDTYEPLLPDLAIDPLLEGVKFQKLSDDIEVIESIADNILAPVNLCSNGSKTTIIMILNLLCTLTLLISQC